MIPVVNFFGVIEDQHQFRHVMDGSEALKIAVIQDMSCLGIITPPGESGFDIVVGEGQSLGLPLSYGGPNVGVFATNKKYMRQIPGRISGLTVDKNGERAFCLTLSTREQHIRREKATSNICSNQALCAFWVTIYLSLLGREGIRRLATLNLQKTHYAMKRLTGIEGVNCRFSSPVYNEFVLDLPGDSERILERLRDKGVLGGVPLSRFFNTDRRGVLVNITEVNTREEIDTFANCLKEVV
jgi:glycine dehydrogenase subunit 1